MKRKGNRLLAGLLTLILVAGTAVACSKNEAKPSPSTVPSAAPPTKTVESTKTPEPKKDPVELSFYSFDSNGKAYPWERAIDKKITEATGVKLKIEYITGTNLEEKAGVMIAGNEYADIIESRGMQSKLVQAGAFIPLDDLIDKYGPHIKKAFGDSLNKLKNPSDGKIYFIPSPKTKPQDIVDANQSLLIQYDVLDKLGYPKIETLDDVYKMLQDYMAKVKDLNGTPFIPWGLWTDTWGYNITINNAALWVNGLTDDSDALVDQKTFDVQYFNTTDKFKTYLKFLNQLYKSNMIDKNSFITKNDQFKSLVATGRVLAMIEGTWDVTDAEAALRKAGMPERAYARFPIVLEKGIKDRSQVIGESYAWGLGISTNCKDPVSAIKFLDWLASDEGAVTLNWGVEGVHYDVVNGKRVMKKEVVDKLNTDPEYRFKEGLQAYSWNQTSGAIKLDDGQYASPLNIEDVYNNSDDWTKKVMDKYGVKAWGQMFDVTGDRPPYGYAWSISIPADSPAQLAAKKADDLRHSLVPGIIMSADDSEFDKHWDDFVKKIKGVNIQAWEQEMSAGIKKRLELWGK
ncbi:extracellular solute-binding protein [Gorillibacterium massiliense]|uniref:extracellular solute-binding protein n=1 Tax=Gorillibacterium massiliense TaxID=1280390 RepID=UPI0004B26EBF|nr:extracellular solute-binding protein [Gorillibacterium massiliense]